MKIRKLALTNVTSFNQRQQLEPDRALTILIGPNGGGKTNLLNTLVDVLRTHFVILNLPDSVSGTEKDPVLQNWNTAEIVRQPNLERHWAGSVDQLIELDLELTVGDVENVQKIQRDFNEVISGKSASYSGVSLGRVGDWARELVKPGTVFSYELRNGGLYAVSAGADLFLDYLRSFEIHRELRSRFGMDALSHPTVHLNVFRSQHGLPLDVSLAGSNQNQTRKSIEGNKARASSGSLLQVAIYSLAQEYLGLIYQHGASRAHELILEKKKCKTLTELLKGLGYTWDIEYTSQRNNAFGIQLWRDGRSVNVSWISSGEQQLLSMAIALTLLDLREAVVVVDEPELHLHPVSQRKMHDLFLELAKNTGNQFILATHSPLFVTPKSINYVARVSSVAGESRIDTVSAELIPGGKHAFQIVNAQNNEKIFFADKVVLVEGPSDEIFFAAMLKFLGHLDSKEIAVVRVGGKGLFKAYQAVLKAFSVPHAVIADMDYLRQIGSAHVKGYFTISEKAIKEIVRDPSSRDGQSLIDAISVAIETKDVASLAPVWAYVEATRGKLPALDVAQQEAVDADIRRLRSEGIAVLSRGALEDYLPHGHRDKDQDKLIGLLHEENWIQMLPIDRVHELKEICSFVAAF